MNHVIKYINRSLRNVQDRFAHQAVYAIMHSRERTIKAMYEQCMEALDWDVLPLDQVLALQLQAVDTRYRMMREVNKDWHRTLKLV